MFERVECPNPAYRRIVKSGLDKILKDKTGIIRLEPVFIS